jgi:hypothetical protein
MKWNKIITNKKINTRINKGDNKNKNKFNNKKKEKKSNRSVEVAQNEANGLFKRNKLKHIYFFLFFKYIHRKVEGRGSATYFSHKLKLFKVYSILGRQQVIIFFFLMCVYAPV